MQEDSLKKRYLYRLTTNIINIPIGIVSQSLIARGLGPAAYGDFSFLTNFFTKIISFLDTGTSIGFFTKLSQRLQDKGLIKFYWLFTLAAAFLTAIFVFASIPLDYKEFFWPEKSTIYIFLALILSFLIWISQVVMRIVDAYGVSAQGEKVRLLIKIAGMFLLIYLYFFITLSLTLFFLYNLFITFLLILSCWYVLYKNGIDIFPLIKLTKDDYKKYLNELYLFSHPLFVLSAVSMLAGILDLWLLQKFGGSVQQGYLGFSLKIGAICILFASSLTSIIMREFSIAFSKNDLNKMKVLFQTYIPSIYTVIAFITIFISVNSYSISFLFGGEGFIPGQLVLTILIVYPIHQTYGQLSSSVFYATGNTKSYRNVTIYSSLIGIFISLFLILPKQYLGLNLGAVGIALKMVILQFIAVNILLFMNAKLLKFSFFKFFSHQLFVFAIFYGISFFSYLVVKQFDLGLIISLIISGVIYSIATFAIFYLKPNLFVMNQSKTVKAYIVKFIKRN